MKMYFIKGMGEGSACLKVVNEKGEELSLAGDDSCGGMDQLRRLTLAKFDCEDLPGSARISKLVGAEIFGIEAGGFLEALAAHLGYIVVPMKKVGCSKAHSCDSNVGGCGFAG